MAKYSYIIIGVLVSALLICAAISAAVSSREVSTVTRKLRESENTIKGLRETNKELLERNNRLTETVGRLEEQIITDNNRAQERLREVETRLAAAAAGIGEAGDSIQGIIEGIREITEILKILQN